jgi:cysteine sulfinate desulfinase/cysteine desulfurase-like protein
MGEAAELALRSLDDRGRVQELRDRLDAGIRALIPGTELNGHPEHRLPNTLNLTLPALRGESMVVALDRYGVSLSSGSACKSGSPEPTHVLIAMGKTAEQAHCAVRLSLSNGTTEQDIDDTIAAFAQVLEEMESTVRFLPCK